jgi:hypothetical protein
MPHGAAPSRFAIALPGGVNSAHARTGRELSELRGDAVKATYPPTGTIPEIVEGCWSPALARKCEHRPDCPADG